MSVEKLIEALKAEGAEREKRTLEEARLEAERILDEGVKSVERMKRERAVDTSRRDEIRRRVNVAQENLAARRRETVLQQAVWRAVQEKVKERWRTFMASDAYPRHIHRRWAEAASLLGKVGAVRADPVTALALRGSGSPAPTIDATIDDGFVALSSDGAVEIHERLAVRLERLWERKGEAYAAPMAEGVADVL